MLFGERFIMDENNINTWLHNEKTIAKSIKPYSHFDYKTNIELSWKYISNPKNIAQHGFYPFIHYDAIQIKYHKKKYRENKGIKKKKRSIYYASHIDSCIYQYYSFLLNEKYNNKVKADGIENVAVAYRTDLKKSNIHFAKSAFDFIRNSTNCFVMIGDFTDFFDNLEHSYLKDRLCNLLDVARLPDDYYAVFKNITKYSYVELTDLLKINNLDDTPRGRKYLNSKAKIISTEEFKNNKKLIHKNPNNYGIPQGSPISALLANIYMLECDKTIHNYVLEHHGFYMRYSDDFIIVIPNVSTDKMKIIYTDIRSFLDNIPNLKLQPEKTQFYSFSSQKLTNCGIDFDSNIDCSNRFLNFLGFTFDGTTISIRDKTISKYYYRMYRKAKTIAKNHGYNKYGKKISNENIYKRYSFKGAYEKPGNFITYVKRAQRHFDGQKSINRSTANHMQKIKKAINKRS